MAASNRMNVRLEWCGDQVFEGTANDAPVRIDGKAAVAGSPVQMLASGLAGCMAIDVVHILGKMRTPPEALAVELTIERAAQDPRRVVAATMTFEVTGAVPPENIQRALAMSRDTYCSVWHSLREDIPLQLNVEIKGSTDP